MSPHAEVFHFGEFVHPVLRTLASDTGLLHPAEGRHFRRNDANMLPTHLVHSDGPHHHHLDNCAFGGPDMKSLYITEALSGDVLVAQMPVAGKKLYGLQ